MQEARSTDAAVDIDLLIEGAIGDDADAFGRLYDMYVDRVYRHVYYRVGSTEDAEDLTQQVFLRAWQAIGRYKKTSSPFLAWLMRISHNLVIDFYRSKKDKGYLDFEIAASDSYSNPERVAEMQFDQQQLRRVILHLPADQQQVILMSFIEGFSYAEIASTLGKSEGAIRVIQHRALKKMRNILEEEKGLN
ncbi:RNA polymerase sigma factor [Chloroflexota bacterium]